MTSDSDKVSQHSTLHEEETGHAITYDHDEGKQAGVALVEEATKVSGWTLYLAWIGIGLVAYVGGLDNNTMYAYITQGATVFEKYDLYPTLTVLQSVLIAVAKLPVAKFSDVFGRAQAYALSLLFYVIGFIIIASSQGFNSLAAGVVFYAIGNTGTSIMQQIVLADTINARWRGTATGLVSLPYVINFAVAPRIVGKIGTPARWRWGAGIFSIIAPVAAAPVILSLAVNQRRAAARLNFQRRDHPTAQVSQSASGWRAIAQRVSLVLQRTYGVLYDFLVDVDAVGLLLICAGWLLVLLPLNLATKLSEGWNSPQIIAMLTVGGCCLIATGLWEGFVASKPILRKSFIINKDVIIPTLCGFFDFFSFYLSWTTVFVWSMITYDFSLSDASYLSNTQSLCLTVFGIASGFLLAYTRRIKWTMFSGSLIRMLGIGLMIRYRTASSSTAQIVIPQVLQGLGGGFLGITLQVNTQVSVKHQDVAMATAFFLLLTEIGGACGNAVIGAVQSNYLRDRIVYYLPNESDTVITSLYTFPTLELSTYPIGSPVRTGLINAWHDYIHILLVIGIVMSAIPILLIPFISDFRLTDTQNCVSEERNAAIGASKTERQRDAELHAPKVDSDVAQKA